MSESMITGLRANYTAIAGKLDALKTGKSGSRSNEKLSGCSRRWIRRSPTCRR